MNKVVHKLVIALVVGVGIAVNALTTFAYTSPGTPQGYVNDYASVLTEIEERTLETLLQNLEISSSVEFSVVIIPKLEDETIETYATKLFEEWKIGKKGLDNGLLLLIAEQDQKLRIEVGYGLEGIITDAFSSRVIQAVLVPAFKQAQYVQGITEAVERISAVIVDPNNATEQMMSDEMQIKDAAASNFLGSEVGRNAIVFGFFFIWLVLKRTPSWWLGGVFGAVISLIYVYVNLGGSSFLMKFVIVVMGTLLGLLLDFIASYLHKHHGSGGFGGFGGFGGSSGGFGGFGGGRSGGGGSSGSW